MPLKYLSAPVVLDPALGERQIMVVASDPTLDRTKDVMNPAGCVLSNYEQNPIVLASHDPTQPIGTAKAAIRNDRVEALIDFAPAGISAKADEYCGLAKAGVLRAVSVGFDPIEFKPNKAGGYDYDKWELMELSLVAVPANPGARIIARAAELDPLEVPPAKDMALLTVKGMWGLACLCEIMENLGFLQEMTAFEAEMEGDGSALPAMLGEAMRKLGDVLIAMSQEEVSELLACAGAIPDAAADDVSAAASVPFVKALALFREKAGRALSASNAEHVAEIGKALDAIAGHHAAASEHVKALFEAGKKPQDDEEPEADEDDELAFTVAQRKRRAAVIALRA